MNFDLNVNLTQEQKLVLTQKMQLSIKILQMSSYELESFINNQLEENPVLEALDNKKEINEIDYEKFIKHLDNSTYDNSGEWKQTEEKISPLKLISKECSLREVLIEQIVLSETKHEIREITYYIIDNIDERGYYDGDINDICKELKVTESDAETALKIVQDLEPCGIGARDLKECLKIQLRKQGLLNEQLKEIVDNYLELIADNKVIEISKRLNIKAGKAQELCDVIKGLEPKPSRGYYTGDEVKYITPDAYVKKIGNDFIVIMNDGVLPELKINDLYKKIILSNDANEEEKKYIKDKFNSASFLMRSIYQRKNTLYRVVNEIVGIQRDYFEYGKECLKPMTLKEISEKLNIHESTVSRAIREKYINCNIGTIKIKDLFTTGISRECEEDISVFRIKQELSKLIQDEDKKKPLSDQKISELLKNKQMNISRRTVAKYREELGIKSSSKRKRF